MNESMVLWVGLALMAGCCFAPDDGPLAEGEYGGEGARLEVGEDGSTSLGFGCRFGDSVSTVEVLDGAITAEFDTADPMAGATQDESDDHVPAILTATVCGGRIDGTLSVDGGGGEPFVVALGRSATEVGENCPQ